MYEGIKQGQARSSYAFPAASSSTTPKQSGISSCIRSELQEDQPLCRSAVGRLEEDQAPPIGSNLGAGGGGRPTSEHRRWRIPSQPLCSLQRAMAAADWGRPTSPTAGSCCRRLHRHRAGAAPPPTARGRLRRASWGAMGVIRKAFLPPPPSISPPPGIGGGSEIVKPWNPTGPDMGTTNCPGEAGASDLLMGWAEIVD